MTVSTTATEGVRTHAEKLNRMDPFVLGPPCWMVRVYPQLPAEPPTRIPASEITRRDQERVRELERTRMAIRTVTIDQAPARLHVRGGISSKQDYIEILQAINNAKDPKQAFIVDMDPAIWVDEHGKPMEKPEVVFANSLRRRFEASALPITAYQSGKLQITVRRFTALELKEKESGKGKRKAK